MTTATIVWAFLRLPHLHMVPKFWAWLLALGIGCPVSRRGMEKLEPGKPYVFACNHSSALDIPALQSVLPSNFRWMAKKELFDIWGFGTGLRSCGYIPVDRSGRREALKSLKAASSRIQEGASVVIFPEGTRSVDGKLLPFKKGGFRLAIGAGVPVVPVGIVGSSRAMPANTLDITPHPIQVRFGDPIDLGQLDKEAFAALPDLVRGKVQELLDQS